MKKKQKDCSENFHFIIHSLKKKKKKKKKKCILNIEKTDLLHELLFHDELSIKKTSEAFKRYAKS